MTQESVWNHSISALESVQVCAAKGFLKYNDASPIKGVVQPRWDAKPVESWGAGDRGSFIHHVIEACVKQGNVVAAAGIIHQWAGKPSCCESDVMVYMSMFLNAVRSAWDEADKNGWAYKNIVMSGIFKRKHGDIVEGVLSHWCKSEWKDVVIGTLQCVYALQEQAAVLFSPSALVEEKIVDESMEVSGYIDWMDPATDHVLDHKTGFKTWTPEMVGSSNQMMMYSLLYYSKFNRLPKTLSIFSIEQGKIINVPFDEAEYERFVAWRLPLLKRAFNEMLDLDDILDVSVSAAGLSGSAAFCPCELAEYCPFVKGNLV